MESLKTLANEQMECIIELAYLTAIRKSDLLQIKLRDTRKDGLHITQQKTGKYQIFRLSPGLNSVISRAKKLRRRHSSFFLFATRKGTPYTTSGFNSNWRRLKQKAELDDIHFHDIRAKSITDEKREKGRDFAQELAGHATGEMTDAYIRDNPDTEPLLLGKPRHFRQRPHRNTTK